MLPIILPLIWVAPYMCLMPIKSAVIYRMRKAKQGEKLTALDGNDYQCNPDITVISDDNVSG